MEYNTEAIKEQVKQDITDFESAQKFLIIFLNIIIDIRANFYYTILIGMGNLNTIPRTRRSSLGRNQSPAH